MIGTRPVCLSRHSACAVAAALSGFLAALPAVATPMVERVDAALVSGGETEPQPSVRPAVPKTTTTEIETEAIELAKGLGNVSPSAGPASPHTESAEAAAAQAAVARETLRDVLHSYVNQRNGSGGPRGPRGSAEAPEQVQDDGGEGLFDLDVRQILLNSEQLGTIVRTMLGQPMGEEGHHAFEIFGMEFRLDRGRDGSLGLYDYRTNSTMLLAEPAPGGDRPRSGNEVGPDERRFSVLLMDFLVSPLGIALAVLAGIVLLVRLLIAISTGVRHVRT